MTKGREDLFASEAPASASWPARSTQSSRGNSEWRLRGIVLVQMQGWICRQNRNSPQCAVRLNPRPRLRCSFLLGIFLLTLSTLISAECRTIKITDRYLNIPIGREAIPRLVRISVGGVAKREFTAKLDGASSDYWVFIDVSESKKETITLSCAGTSAGLDRIYQSNAIEGAASL